MHNLVNFAIFDRFCFGALTLEWQKAQQERASNPRKIPDLCGHDVAHQRKFDRPFPQAVNQTRRKVQPCHIVGHQIDNAPVNITHRRRFLQFQRFFVQHRCAGHTHSCAQLNVIQTERMHRQYGKECQHNNADRIPYGRLFCHRRRAAGIVQRRKICEYHA